MDLIDPCSKGLPGQMGNAAVGSHFLIFASGGLGLIGVSEHLLHCVLSPD